MNSKLTISAVLALSCSLLVLAAGPAAPATVVFNCTGTISLIKAQGILDSSVAVGTPYAATYFLDTKSADLDDFSQTGFGYVDKKPEDTARVQFGNYGVGPDPLSYAFNTLDGVNDGGPLDQMIWGSENGSGSGLKVQWAMARFEDWSGQALISKGLPPTGPGMNDVSAWPYHDFWFSSTASADGTPSEWLGTVDSISTHIQENPVPEPGSLALLAVAGLPALGTLHRKRRG